MSGAPIDLLAECEAHGIRLTLAGDGGFAIDAPHNETTIRRDCGRCGRFLDGSLNALGECLQLTIHLGYKPDTKGK